MIPLIIDTDMGGDIDDALALSMALHSPRLDILGVTTVYRGNAWRCDLIKRMLSAYGRADIPVFFGAENPLNGEWGEAENRANDAAAFIAQTAQRQRLTLLSIGPMTNAAQAISTAPDIAQNLHIYAMGGMLGEERAEWNVLCDPEAADIVLSSGAHITLVGLDVTERCLLTRAQSDALVAGEGAEMAFLRGEMARFYALFSFLPTLHDPLTLLCLLSPDVCRYEMKDIVADTSKGPTRGVTRERRPPQSTNIRVAVSVDADRAIAGICQLVRGERLTPDSTLRKKGGNHDHH